MPPGNQTATPTVGINGTGIEGPKPTDSYVHPGEVNATIQQGPEWLVNLLITPPGWVWGIYGVVLAVVVGLLALSLYRNEGIPDDARREVVEIGAVVGAIALATAILTEVASLPYLVDVVGGTVIGWVVASTVVEAADPETETRWNVPRL